MKKNFKNKALKNMITFFPQKTISKFAGKFTHSSSSKFLIKPYYKIYKINISEIEKPVSEYNTMTEFFTRKLKNGTRIIDNDPDHIVSPVDGTISEYGEISDGKLIQAKGIYYTVENLIGSSEEAQKYKKGSFITIYLSPKDYHRIHMPSDASLISYTYIKGRLFPVNGIGVNEVKGLFTKNERLVSNFNSKTGNYCVVKVGAFIVGSVKVNYNHHIDYKKRIYSSPISSKPLQKGEELGYFEFGSTVILLFENKLNFSDHIYPQCSIKMGQKIAVSNN